MHSWEAGSDGREGAREKLGSMKKFICGSSLVLEEEMEFFPFILCLMTELPRLNTQTAW